MGIAVGIFWIIAGIIVLGREYGKEYLGSASLPFIVFGILLIIFGGGSFLLNAISDIAVEIGGIFLFMYIASMCLLVVALFVWAAKGFLKWLDDRYEVSRTDELAHMYHERISFWIPTWEALEERQRALSRPNCKEDNIENLTKYWQNRTAYRFAREHFAKEKERGLTISIEDFMYECPPPKSEIKEGIPSPIKEEHLESEEKPRRRRIRQVISQEETEE